MVITDGKPVDLLVVGGGINGAGIARDAAGRGLSVVLVEQGDLAQATSSASSKLIHGGLRYLEHYEFRLVREALAEREVLLGIAPHIIWPLSFVLPHDSSLRPRWMIRSGLFLYDHLSRRTQLPSSRGVSLKSGPLGAPLKSRFVAGFTYADCWVDDSRLVVLNAIDAAERGALIRTRTRFLGAEKDGELWRARLAADGLPPENVAARMLVNAAGPWVGSVLASTGRSSRLRVRLVKGSHIIVPRLYPGEHAYILQNADRRVVFVIPYERRFSLIGTTDVPFDGEPDAVAIGADEIEYLCAAVGRFFDRPPAPMDVVATYSGVRPLHDDAADDPSAVTRDYELEISGGNGAPVLLSVFGGKITTYRRLAEHALHDLSGPGRFADKPWTARQPLPGGDLGAGDFATFLADVHRRWPWLGADEAHRLARAYGTRIGRVLAGAGGRGDLGRDLGAGLSEREVEYLIAHEWARSADDILQRRSKLYLHGGKALQDCLKDWLAARSR
jgi:glycerol-3-phosphate dehydrogenase